ncbi:MAG: adenosylcobinamide-GDP ribazoletransferase [Motilibacteraceae bacterium]
MRLSVGTLTVLRVPPPRRVDAAVARVAMLAGPAVGLVLAALAGVVAVGADAAGLAPLPVAALALAALALLTRGLHLDGLADLADGLGSARPAEGALEVMKRSDVGPFGVVTLVLALLLQAAALAQAWGVSRPDGLAALAVAVVTGRTAITLACRPGVPTARPGGLGATVAGTVPAAGALLMPLVVAGLAALARPALALAVAVGVLAALLLERRAVHRLGGITGDVLGALCEVAATAALLTAAATTTLFP